MKRPGFRKGYHLKVGTGNIVSKNIERVSAHLARRGKKSREVFNDKNNISRPDRFGENSNHDPFVRALCRGARRDTFGIKHHNAFMLKHRLDATFIDKTSESLHYGVLSRAGFSNQKHVRLARARKGFFNRFYFAHPCVARESCAPRKHLGGISFEVVRISITKIFCNPRNAFQIFPKPPPRARIILFNFRLNPLGGARKNLWFYFPLEEKVF